MVSCSCEYCDISLTHSSVPGRKQHHSGRKHIMNFIEYWSNFQPAVPAPVQKPAPPQRSARLPHSRCCARA